MEQTLGSDDAAVPLPCAGRIAFSIFKYSPYGGLQQDMMRLAQEFRRRHFEVVIYCMIWDAPAPPEGISFCELGTRGFSNHRKARIFEKMLAGELAKENYLAHVAFNRLSPSDWSFIGDMPFVNSVPRGFLEKMMPRYQTFAAMEKEVLAPGSSSGLFFITKAQQDAYHRLYETPLERMHLLPPGINSEFADALKLRENRDDLRASLGIGEEDILLIQISSAFRTKGVDRSIAALAALPEQVRFRTKLLIVGMGNVRNFAALADSCGVADRVMFAGARDDVAELLTAADLMLHPARNEAAGSVLLEALACGTPVLCSSNCGFSPFVKEAGSPVLPGKFRQKLLNRTLMLTLSTPGRLEELQREAENFGSHADFYRRAEVAADLILQRSRV